MVYLLCTVKENVVELVPAISTSMLPVHMNCKNTRVHSLKRAVGATGEEILLRDYWLHDYRLCRWLHDYRLHDYRLCRWLNVVSQSLLLIDGDELEFLLSLSTPLLGNDNVSSRSTWLLVRRLVRSAAILTGPQCWCIRVRRGLGVKLLGWVVEDKTSHDEWVCFLLYSRSC